MVSKGKSSKGICSVRLEIPGGDWRGGGEEEFLSGYLPCCGYSYSILWNTHGQIQKQLSIHCIDVKLSSSAGTMHPEEEILNL